MSLSFKYLQPYIAPDKPSTDFTSNISNADRDLTIKDNPRLVRFMAKKSRYAGKKRGMR